MDKQTAIRTVISNGYNIITILQIQSNLTAIRVIELLGAVLVKVTAYTIYCVVPVMLFDIFLIFLQSFQQDTQNTV